VLQDTNGTFFGTSYGPGVNFWGSVFTFNNELPAFVTISPAYGTAAEQVTIQGQGFLLERAASRLTAFQRLFKSLTKS
jgi:hypothetical protein